MDMINQSGTDSKSWLTSANFFPAEVSLTVGTKFGEYQFLLIFKILSIPIYIALLQLSQLVHWIGWLREQQMVPYPPRGFSSSWCDVFYWNISILSNLYTLGSIEIHQSLTFFPCLFFRCLLVSFVLFLLSLIVCAIRDLRKLPRIEEWFPGIESSWDTSLMATRNPEAEANHPGMFKKPCK